MKRFLFIMLSLALTLSCFACDSGVSGSNNGNEAGSNDASGNALTGKVDLDLTILNDPYNTLLGFMTNPSDYQGKTVAVKATNSVLYNFSRNTVEHIMLGYDPTGCCNAYYKIKTSDGVYPANDSETTFEGKFTSDGYIEVSGYSAKESSPSVEIDTLTMSSDELKSFIESFSVSQSSSENFGKTVRVFGHLIESEGYYYFLGLDSNGQQTWYIEAYEPTNTVQMPLGISGYLNPVELIGTMSVYYEGENAFPCITVTDANRVEGVFS